MGAILITGGAGFLGVNAAYAFADWRVGDQRYFVSDNREVQRVLGWSPSIGFAQGLQNLLAWVEPTSPQARRAA